MKTTSAILLAGIMVAGVSGMILAFDETPLTSLAIAESATGISQPVQTVGHITFTVFDENGDIKQYRQTDNTVLNEGEDCLATLTFDSAIDGAGNCDHADVEFDGIWIGNQNAGAITESATNLTNPIDVANATNVNLTAASGATGSQTSLDATFSFTTALNIDEAGLANSVSNGTLGNVDAHADFLAIQTFTDIPVTSSDTLNVDWTITLG
ncbi:hypothetical protein AAA799P11_01231 [Marine Group I thaumarchaeote SCGC AAA799-P11]|uniref:Uncharacterized protein n=1 Tax=Marine Group I thaumarchaeote SCGC AAA799-P11 TaxID=1502295 RepID=A0A087RX70_9ARCH|nr:hypothetical protein AAA799P11_01231 [Marine Group I thaumarchaeote SCGC AAA799-P11]